MLKSLEKKSIALCVIAKNEVYALQRCILSAKPLVDFVLVVDTGSTDGTQKKARELMHSISIPGEVIEEPWQNFAYNRTYALAQLRARTSIDYGLMLDADQVLMYSPNFSPSSFKAGLAADAYDVCIKLGGIEYFQPQLTSNRLNIVYKGVLHEYREIPANASRDRVEGFVIEEVRDGSRSKNPKKYQDDAALLQEAIAGRHGRNWPGRENYHTGCSACAQELLHPTATASIGPDNDVSVQKAQRPFHWPSSDLSGGNGESAWKGSQLTAEFRGLGLGDGDLVLVHSSLRKLGRVVGGADAVIDSLLEAVGPNGTVAMPAHTYRVVNEQQPVFHWLLTPSNEGALTNVFRQRPGAIRSLHPTHSVAAIGPRAEALVAGHECDDTPCSKTSPYGRLRDWAGKVLIIGVDLRCCTLFHGCEQWASMPWAVSDRTIQLYSICSRGDVISVPTRTHVVNTWDQYPKLEPHLLNIRALRLGYIGGCELRLLDASAAAAWLVAQLQEDQRIILPADHASRISATG
jgi:aminoglycoside N3'-acetyltransferase